MFCQTHSKEEESPHPSSPWPQCLGTRGSKPRVEMVGALLLSVRQLLIIPGIDGLPGCTQMETENSSLGSFAIHSTAGPAWQPTSVGQTLPYTHPTAGWSPQICTKTHQEKGKDPNILHSRWEPFSFPHPQGPRATSGILPATPSSRIQGGLLPPVDDILLCIIKP